MQHPNTMVILVTDFGVYYTGHTKRVRLDSGSTTTNRSIFEHLVGSSHSEPSDISDIHNLQNSKYLSVSPRFLLILHTSHTPQMDTYLISSR